MDMEVTAMPTVGAPIQPNDNSAVMAHQITKLLNENSLSKMQEYFERLKALMSCYGTVDRFV